MHALRLRPPLARLVLAWFVAAVCAAFVSPLVQARTFELVCSASGGVHLKVLGEDGDEDAQAGHAVLDCALCLPVAPPPPVRAARIALPQPLAHASRPLVAARIASLVGAPLPARGPPSRS